MAPRGRAGRGLSPAALAVALLVGTLSSIASAQQKGASVLLRARWEGTPYVLEAAEFLVRIDGLCE
jgi:hypothetical protein